MKLAYLASPYSHDNRKVMVTRHAVNVVMSAYILQGGSGEKNINVFSPIAHSHFMSDCGVLPETWDFWRDKDFDILRRCDAVYVLKIPGWKESIGVKAEVLFALECEIPVHDVNVLRDSPVVSDLPSSEWLYTKNEDLHVSVVDFFTGEEN